MAVTADTHGQASPNAIRWRRRVSLLQDAFLSLFFAATALVHAHAFATEGIDRIASLFFGIEQALLFTIWITRRRSYATTPRPYDWFVATGGAWLILVVRPADAISTSLLVTGVAIQCVGLVMTIVAIGYLGKSFGIVAAHRGLKVNGPYRLVRHPVYFAHAISNVGFLIANTTPWNISIVLIVTMFQVLRIQSEERWLSETADYAEYASKVRWRLLPGIF